MLITSISTQKNQKSTRVNIFLDGEFGFAISQKLLVDFKLHEGKKLSEKAIEKIIKKDFEERFYERCLNLIARRPRSEEEIRRYLRRKFGNVKMCLPTGDLPKGGKYENVRIDKEKLIDALIGRLKEKGYLNDFEFAKWWVENRMEFQPRGRRMLVSELRQKGVEGEEIEKTLDKVGLTEEVEIEMAKKVLKKKKSLVERLAKSKEKNKAKIKKKLADFLGRKGFGWEVVRKIVDS